MLLFHRRVDSSDKDKPDRPVWPPSRSYLVFVGGNYEQKKDIKPKPVRPRLSARRRANPFIDTEAGVYWDASADEETDDENDDLDGFTIADDVEY